MSSSTVATADSFISVERDSGEPGRMAADRLDAVRLELDAEVRRLEGAKARLRATIGQVGKGRPRQEILRHSAFGRLQAKLESMPVIEQAKGILMAEQRCGPDEAFDLLRRASQRANVKVSVLAARIVEQVTLHRTGNGALPARPAVNPHLDRPRSRGPRLDRVNGQRSALGGGG